jgi:hypothetical protein
MAGLFTAHVAQSVEHFLGKEEVMGSIPVVGSLFIRSGEHRNRSKGPAGFGEKFIRS